MRLRLRKVTVADVLAAQPVTTNLLKFMRASIKMIGVSNLQSFIASMTQKLTMSDISFFFSSRRRHTRCLSDWSSDVCSSDLVAALTVPAARELAQFGIRVNAVAPGIFATPMLRALPDEVQAGLAASVPFPKLQIGRAACREREENSGGAVL